MVYMSLLNVSGALLNPKGIILNYHNRVDSKCSLLLVNLMNFYLLISAFEVQNSKPYNTSYYIQVYFYFKTIGDSHRLLDGYNILFFHVIYYFLYFRLLLLKVVQQVDNLGCLFYTVQHWDLYCLYSSKNAFFWFRLRRSKTL